VRTGEKQLRQVGKKLADGPSKQAQFRESEGRLRIGSETVAEIK
jgi:hypothetical protein